MTTLNNLPSKVQSPIILWNHLPFPSISYGMTSWTLSYLASWFTNHTSKIFGIPTWNILCFMVGGNGLTVRWALCSLIDCNQLTIQAFISTVIPQTRAPKAFNKRLHQLTTINTPEFPSMTRPMYYGCSWLIKWSALTIMQQKAMH